MLIKPLADHTQHSIPHPQHLSQVLSEDSGPEIYPVLLFKVLENIRYKNRSAAILDELVNNEPSPLMNFLELD